MLRRLAVYVVKIFVEHRRVVVGYWPLLELSARPFVRGWRGGFCIIDQ